MNKKSAGVLGKYMCIDVLYMKRLNSTDIN